MFYHYQQRLSTADNPVLYFLPILNSYFDHFKSQRAHGLNGGNLSTFHAVHRNAQHRVARWILLRNEAGACYILLLRERILERRKIIFQNVNKAVIKVRWNFFFFWFLEFEAKDVWFDSAWRCISITRITYSILKFKDKAIWERDGLKWRKKSLFN